MILCVLHIWTDVHLLWILLFHDGQRGGSLEKIRWLATQRRGRSREEEESREEDEEIRGGAERRRSRENEPNLMFVLIRGLSSVKHQH